MMSEMHAVRYSVRGPPTVLSLETIPVPEPKDDQVLVKILYAGVNPVDTHLRGPHHPNLVVPLPATPGKDASGTISAVGARASQFKIGDKVFVCDHGFRSGGTYAEYHVADATEVHLLPAHYSLQEGAAIGSPCFTAARALFIAAQAKPGETLLVHGASGPVGTACVQMGVAHGLMVYGTAGTEEGLQRTLNHKAAAVFNHRESGYTDKIKEAVGTKGVNIIIEMSAGTNLQKDLELLARKGRIVVVGGKGPVSIVPAMILAKEAIVTGVKLSDSSPEEWTKMTRIVEDGMHHGWLRPILDKEYTLDEARKTAEVDHAVRSLKAIAVSVLAAYHDQCRTSRSFGFTMKSKSQVKNFNSEVKAYYRENFEVKNSYRSVKPKVVVK